MSQVLYCLFRIEHWLDFSLQNKVFYEHKSGSDTVKPVAKVYIYMQVQLTDIDVSVFATKSQRSPSLILKSHKQDG